jgi:hypothetical protein
MANIVHLSNAATLAVTNLVMSDKAGTGPCVVQPPSGTSIAMLGLRQGYNNQTGDYTLLPHQSNYVWTNTGASALTYTLPSGSPNGYTAWFCRTGGVLSVSPSTVGRIWHSSSGLFRSTGTSVSLASMGSKIRLVCDGNNGWYPTLEEGTIN